MKKIFASIIFLIASVINAQFITEVTDSIVATDTLSGYYDTVGKDVAFILMPAAFTGTALTFKTSADTTSGNFKDVYDADGNIVTVTVAASRHIVMTPIKTWAFRRYVKLESDSTEAASRTIIIGLDEL